MHHPKIACVLRQLRSEGKVNLWKGGPQLSLHRLDLPGIAQADQVELHLAQLSRAGLRLAQADHHPRVLKGLSGLIDANHPEGAAQQAKRVAHFQAHPLCRRPADDDLAAARQRLALDDAVPADGVLARMVAVHDQHRHLIRRGPGPEHPRDRIYVRPGSDACPHPLVDGAEIHIHASLGSEQIGLAVPHHRRERAQHAPCDPLQGNDGRNTHADA